MTKKKKLSEEELNKRKVKVFDVWFEGMVQSVFFMYLFLPSFLLLAIWTTIIVNTYNPLILFFASIGIIVFFAPVQYIWLNKCIKGSLKNNEEIDIRVSKSNKKIKIVI